MSGAISPCIRTDVILPTKTPWAVDQTVVADAAEAGLGVLQEGHPVGILAPGAGREALGAGDLAATSLGQLQMVLAQDVDAEARPVVQRPVEGGGLVDADQKRGRR
jgi:hypothetical protein